MAESDNRPPAKPRKAVRLTFSYEGDKVELISQQPIEMTVPSSDPVQGFAEQKGFWAEVKDKQNRTLYRRVLHNPMRPDVEVFSNEPEQSVSRHPAPDQKGVFVVVVPDMAEGQELTLSSSSGHGRGHLATETQPASEIGRFRLKK